MSKGVLFLGGLLVFMGVMIFWIGWTGHSQATIKALTTPQG